MGVRDTKGVLDTFSDHENMEHEARSHMINGV